MTKNHPHAGAISTGRPLPAGSFEDRLVSHSGLIKTLHDILKKYTMEATTRKSYILTDWLQGF